MKLQLFSATSFLRFVYKSTISSGLDRVPGKYLVSILTHRSCLWAIKSDFQFANQRATLSPSRLTKMDFPLRNHFTIDFNTDLYYQWAIESCSITLSLLFFLAFVSDPPQPRRHNRENLYTIEKVGDTLF